MELIQLFWNENQL